MEKVAKLLQAVLSLFLLCVVLYFCYNVGMFTSQKPPPAMVQRMESELEDEGVNFTSVVMASDSDTLQELLDFHCLLPCVQKIIVVWNNLETRVPSRLYNYPCAVNVSILPQRDNSINNQFKPFRQIETDAVFITQEAVTLSRYDFLLGLEAWKQFPHLLVGYTPWRVNKGVKAHSYSHDIPKEKYNIMLSDAMFVHKKYLKIYTKKAPLLLYNEIHSHHNGDRFSRDILMNLVVGKYLQKEAVPQSACLWVKANSWDSKGLVADGDSAMWLNRNSLLMQIERHYKYALPLYDTKWAVSHKDDLQVFHRTE